MKFAYAGCLLACLANSCLATESGAATPPQAAAAPARAPESTEQLEIRLASVAKLIESSSAAQQIAASGAAEASALRDKARELHRQASQAHAGGRGARAAQLLDQAAQTLFLAVRAAAPGQLDRARKQRAFDLRMETVNALLGAQKRISAEKQQPAHPDLEAQRRRAAELAAAGRLDEGAALLAEVYERARESIESMRSGDTLVRSLNFATREEEYHYELDRNDTHAMLVKVLLDEKRAGNPGLDGMVRQYLDKARALRGEAAAKAAGKDFESAVRLLEQATAELVRAIRSAGVYIPG